MTAIQKIISYFRNKKIAKKLNSQIQCWTTQLRIFEIINLEQMILDAVESLRNHDRYSALVCSFDKHLKEVAEHNKKVSVLQNSFDDILRNHPIKTILNKIDEYSFSLLQQFNKTALLIGEYTIPDSFTEKKNYLTYMRDIGEIIEDYPKVVEQFSLIRDFDAISYSLGDEYIDDETAEKIFAPARTLLDKIKTFGSKYYSIPKLDEKIIERHNEQFIRNHLKDKIFDDINGKSLDVEQRRAILCDSKSNLTIAGAGAGKTLTICGKVKWLIETGKANENEILLLSYSKASADDLAEKVARMQLDLKVKTFHSFGLEVLTRANGFKKAIESQFNVYIKKFFDEEMQNNPRLVELVFRFFSYYLYSDTDETKYATEGEKFENLKTLDYRTLKDRLKMLSNHIDQFETIQKEYVKSYEELVLANFLFANGIAYEYERAYEVDTATLDKRQYTPDFYLTDYHIYLEHYGVDENWNTPQYTKAEEKNYLESIQWKRKIHEQNHTVCIETYSYEFKNGQIFKNLQQRLINRGVKFKPLSRQEIMDAFHSIYMGQEFTSLFNLISTFINLYKAQYSNENGFQILRERKFSTQYNYARAMAFLDICQAIYEYYIKTLRAEHKIDFDDMILQAIDALKGLPNYKYKYVIVDEFQDISQSRTKLLKGILLHGNSKLFAVGDDWQAIYRFAGCDIGVFLHFKDYFEGARLNYITTTHRNSAELQEIVEPFITANPEQFVKHIQSIKHEKMPVRIIYHDNDRRYAFVKALRIINKIDSQATVLVLGRNRHDIDCILDHNIRLDKEGKLYCNQFGEMKITYKTVHQSKGLEADYVILISGENARNGFPNKMEDDCLLDMVLGSKSSYEFAEERRLFYVALTRTRNIVFILCDMQRPSVFITEIESKVKNENSESLSRDKTNDLLCPKCKSGKLLLRKKNIDESQFYGCSNYPYCQYSISDLKAVSRNNRCPDCGDFLVIRKGRYGNFIGCHNYPYCRFTRKLNEYSK